MNYFFSLVVLDVVHDLGNTVLVSLREGTSHNWVQAVERKFTLLVKFSFNIILISLIELFVVFLGIQKIILEEKFLPKKGAVTTVERKFTLKPFFPQKTTFPWVSPEMVH